ncbi:DUF4123 domain-containing protein [Jannaschia pohangensis]|uniref:DUF4123 domain-containing protein n=1 Tax=Jannaschia pohangensis TaxID=390807 RepID=A0A1I3MY28_9RHOB|nr:DUF4123 domain-containing protein [Jannaschia pohangensis]SFJ01690.1 protein of unknown function [Jannaschia pohangensis]
MIDGKDGDYWTSLPDVEGDGQDASSGLLVFHKIAGAEADAWGGCPTALFAALPEAPPTLLAALYGPDAPRRAYLLVDGTLRALIAGLFDLDVIMVHARSLFEDEAAETTGESGPWLVDLSIADPNAPGDISVLRDFFARHWPAGLSVLISTNAPFDVLRGHLRRFTKLPVVDDERMLTFRFWDPRVLGPFLDAIATDPSRLRRMTVTDDGHPIAYLLLPAGGEDADRSEAIHFAPVPALQEEPLRPMRLRYADFDATARAQAEARRAHMADRLRADFPAELADRPPKAVQAVVDAAVARFEAFGFRDHAHLHLFAAWSLFYGATFERGDPTGELEAILRGDAPEAERFGAFRRRFETFAVDSQRGAA